MKKDEFFLSFALETKTSHYNQLILFAFLRGCAILWSALHLGNRRLVGDSCLHLGPPHTCLLFCTYFIPEPLPWVSKRTLLLQLRTSAIMSTRLCLTMSWRRCDHWPSQALYHFSSLQVYALYKQATIGDVNTSRPGMLDFKVANPIPSRESHSSKHEIMNTCTILWKKSLHWINLNFNLIISLLKIQGKAKWDAWNGKKGMDQVNQVLFE